MARYDKLKVAVHKDGIALAEAAAAVAEGALAQAVRTWGRAAIVLATGNSQREFLARLVKSTLPWSSISVLHMDEYVGLDAGHPASFRRYLREHLLEPLGARGPAAFHGLRGDAPDLPAEIRRYEKLLRLERPEVCVLGIGENGHLAFNDPPADFTTAALVHHVTLDEACREQQVAEGHFTDFELVPREALTMTVPALLRIDTVIGVVPERRKANAVRQALEGPISEDCPASALRGAPNAVLHLDVDSASLLQAERS